MMIEIKTNTILNFILLFSIFALSGAYFIQYTLGHQPCNLCLFERIPYYLSISLIVLNMVFKKFQKIILTLLSLTFICAAILSFYHLGIEQGFIKDSFVCNLNSTNNSLSAEDILKELNSISISCKDVTFRFLGFSLATINTIISVILSIIIIKLTLINEKNK
jgi:disulfide bond formation protein DsbB